MLWVFVLTPPHTKPVQQTKTYAFLSLYIRRCSFSIAKRLEQGVRQERLNDESGINFIY